MSALTDVGRRIQVSIWILNIEVGNLLDHGQRVGYSTEPESVPGLVDLIADFVIRQNASGVNFSDQNSCSSIPQAPASVRH